MLDGAKRLLTSLTAQSPTRPRVDEALEPTKVVLVDPNFRQEANKLVAKERLILKHLHAVRRQLLTCEKQGRIRILVPGEAPIAADAAAPAAAAAAGASPPPPAGSPPGAQQQGKGVAAAGPSQEPHTDLALSPDDSQSLSDINGVIRRAQSNSTAARDGKPQPIRQQARQAAAGVHASPAVADLLPGTPATSAGSKKQPVKAPVSGSGASLDLDDFLGGAVASAASATTNAPSGAVGSAAGGADLLDDILGDSDPYSMYFGKTSSPAPSQGARNGSSSPWADVDPIGGESAPMADPSGTPGRGAEAAPSSSALDPLAAPRKAASSRGSSPKSNDRRSAMSSPGPVSHQHGFGSHSSPSGALDDLLKFPGGVASPSSGKVGKFGARVEREIQHKQAEAVERLHEQDREHTALQEQRRKVADELETRLDRWEFSNGATDTRKGYLALIDSLPSILWAGSGWKHIPLSEMLTSAAAIRRAKKQCLLVLHPDKVGRDSPMENRVIAERAFNAINLQWKAFLPTLREMESRQA